MATSKPRKQPLTLNAPSETTYFKTCCIACFVVLRSTHRIFDEMPDHLRDLGNEVREAWRESARR